MFIIAPWVILIRNTLFTPLAHVASELVVRDVAIATFRFVVSCGEEEMQKCVRNHRLTHGPHLISYLKEVCKLILISTPPVPSSIRLT